MNEIFELDLEDGGLSTIKELDKLEQLILVNGTAEGIDEELRDEYLRYDRSLLVNDPRRKEPKHQLGRGARKKKQKSYR